jgi:hypothetical protein
MNIELRKIIADFQSQVEEANNLLKKHLNTDEPYNWGALEKVGVLDGKYKYFFHGVGCKFHFSKKNIIDFDYGEHGRIDGFDEWRLSGFIRTRQKKYPNIREVDIKTWFQEAIEANEIMQSESREFGSLFYIVKTTKKAILHL